MCIRDSRFFGPASTDVGRRIDRDHIGRLSVNYRRDIGQLSANMSTDTMVPIDISADSRPIPWVITTAKRQIKSTYFYRINTIDRCMERYIDRCPDRYIDLCLDRYIDRYTRWSIGTISVKHRWSIGEVCEVSVNDRSVGRYIVRYSTDISTEHRPLHGPYSIDTWSSVGRDIDRYIDRYIGRGPP